MTHRIRMGTAWSIAALVLVSMVVGAYLWQGPRAAVMTAVGYTVALVGVLVTWSRARALPSPTPRGGRHEPPSPDRHTTEQPPPSS